jgi:antitoxin component HigA of HigAB toxin-antitoxin module
MEKGTMTTRVLTLPDAAPESFEDLCKIHTPRTISDKVAFENTVQVMDWIAVRARTQDQYDYAKTLGILVTEYEIAAGNRVEVSLVGLALLKEIVQQSGVTQAKLASIMGIEQGTVSKIMTGARSITVDHAKRLAKHFKVRASALLEV